MPSVKISVTVDAATLRELREFAGNDANISALVNAGLERELKRLQFLALLDEMDERNPISEEGRKKGEELWQRIESSLMQARSRRSPRKKKASA